MITSVHGEASANKASLLAGKRQETSLPRGAELALGAPEPWWSLLMEHGPAAVLITRVHGDIVHTNAAFLAMLERAADEISGQCYDAFLHPADRLPCAARLGALQNEAGGASVHFPARWLTKTGSIAWCQATAWLVKPPHGPRCIVVVMDNVTKQRELEARLAVQSELVFLGQVAAKIAHEIRNPLTGMSAALSIIAERTSLPPNESQVLSEVINRLALLHELVDTLLYFARPPALHFSRTSLVEVLAAAQTLSARHRTPRDVETQMRGADVTLQADAAQLTRAFAQVLINAAQAMEDKGGVVQVEIGPPADGGVQITVTDAGTGLAADLQARVFEPFFTTRARSIGLGLTLAQRTIRAHGGEIDMARAPGGGTTVLIKLPVDATVAARQPA